MTYLDDVPQDWTRPEYSALRDVLVHAYPRRADAAALAEAAGLVPGTFPERDDMRTTWTALIRVLGDQGRLAALVENAMRDPARAAYKERLGELLSGAPVLAPPQKASGDGDWWRGADRTAGAEARLRRERLMHPRSRLMEVELAAEVVSAARSVARLSLRFGDERGHGTGFLIAAGLLLTNFHNVVHEKFGPATSVVAEFDHDQGKHETPLVRRVNVEPCLSSPDGDWAVLMLESPVDRVPLRLGTPFDIGVDDLVVIIQHPHGAFKQFALEPLAIRYVDELRIQYVADTQQGSSGSPVFNEKMHVIALHQAEAPTAAVDGSGRLWYPQGRRIEPIMQELASRNIQFGPDV